MAVRPSVRTCRITRPPLDGFNKKKLQVFFFRKYVEKLYILQILTSVMYIFIKTDKYVRHLCDEFFLEK